MLVPFPFRFNAVDFGNGANGGVHLTSNGQILFGKGLVVSSKATALSPAVRSVHVTAAADSSWLRLYVHNQTAPVRRLRVRYEGYYGGRAQLAAPNVVWEASFWPNNTLSVCVGGTNALVGLPAAVSGVSNGAGTWLAAFKPALRTQFVINRLADYN